MSEWSLQDHDKETVPETLSEWLVSQGALDEGGDRSELPSLKVEDYHWLAEIGRGGNGRVYKARHRRSGELVAVKVLFTQLEDAIAAERMVREIEALVRIRHPYVVGVKDFGWQNQKPYLVMGWIDGGPLRRWIEERLDSGLGSDIVELARVGFAGLAEALCHIHERGLAHRDVTPDNILVETSSKSLILIDLGLVKSLGPKPIDPRLTHSDDAVGTPCFMSPEQLLPPSSGGVIGPATDVWGLGASLYFALTGREPFLDPDWQALSMSILRADPNPPSQLNPAVPRWLDRLVLECLDKNPSKRPPMDKLAQRLARGGFRWRRSLGLVAAILLLLGAGVLVLILSTANPARILELSPEGSLVLSAPRTVEINGRASRPGLVVRAGDQEVVSDGEGRFTIAIDLRALEGSSLAVTIEDQGRVLDQRNVGWVFDDDAPRFEISGLREDGVLSLAPGAGIVGRVLEPHLDRLLFSPGGGQALSAVACDEKGYFTIPRERFAGAAQIELLACDKATNETRRRIALRDNE